MLASSSRTGPAERMLGDAEQLRALNHEVRVAVDTRRPGNLQEVAAAHGLSVVPLYLSRQVRPGEVLDDLRTLRRLLPSVDVAHTHFAHDHFLALWGARGQGEHLRLVRAVENDAQFVPNPARRWAYRRTDGFEVATAARAGALAERFGIAPERVVVLPGAVDADRFSPAPASFRFRQKLGLGSNALVVGMVARLKPERAQRTLIAAFAPLQAQFPLAHLVLIGRGEDESFLRAGVQRQRLESAVSFAGYWQGADLVEAYRGLDVAVWLREGSDGTSRGVLEAMAVGLPVVAGRQGAMSELISDGRTGLLVEPRDVTGLTAALQRLLSSPALRSDLGAAGRAQVVTHHGWERRGKALAGFYQRLRERPCMR
jgi:glycosyltransferase involved in cell wall biosynthesis